MPTPPRRPRVDDRRAWILATIGLVLAGIAIRMAVDFSHAYPPGSNAGYYPMQSRWLLVHGRLMYDDLPLVFWMNAGLAKLAVACGWELDAAVMAASRLIRAVIPPFVAVPIMALGYHWSGGRRQALAGCAAVAMMTVASAPVMRGTSMDKTSVGLVWMATAVWASTLAMSRPSPGGWLALFACLLVSALSHIGAFGVTAFMVGLAVGH